MRKLATIRKISFIKPIENADAIEIAIIDGWQVVVKRGEFKVGDSCLYLEIDSFLPDGNPIWQFLVDKSPREFEGRRGHCLRTIKLRGALSQGFIIPLDLLPSVKTALAFEKAKWAVLPFDQRPDFDESSFDFSEILGIVKYEPPIPATLAGEVVGLFPSWIYKTDQQRCQNIVDEIFIDNKNAKYEVTIKLDGSSMTVFARQSNDMLESGVCSRNLQLKINENNSDNTFVRVAMASNLLQALEKLAKSGRNIAIQGELMGPGIQKNREQLSAHTFFIFDAQDLNQKNRYYTPNERYLLVKELYENYGVNQDLVKHVPIVSQHSELHSELNISTIEQLLNFADGRSLNHKIREGLVFKRIDGQFSFKVISNSFLLNEK